MGMASTDVKKLLVVASALAATLTVLVAVRATAGPYDWAADPVLFPHCDPSRPAVAHQNGQLLTSQPADGPVPCGMLTGWPTVENRIEVTNAGALIYMPAVLAGGPLLGGDGHVPGWGRQNGVARSFDEGRSWDSFSVQVWPETYVLDSGVDSNLYVDHDTGRLLFYMMHSGPVGAHFGFDCAGGGGSTVAFSDDNGTTWSWGFDPTHGCAENPTILTGKPTVSTPTAMAYPNVVYLCGDNTSTGVAATLTPGFSCSKSLDGGRTWVGTGLRGLAVTKGIGGTQGFYGGSSASYPGCTSPSAGANVQPLPNGTLVVVVSCTEGTYLAKSADEGATWSLGPKLPSGGSIRTDSLGNLYKLGSSGDQNLLSHSTDGGATWSTERNMRFPGVTSIGTNFFVQGTHQAGQVGHVAFAYYGVRPDNNGYSDGFITETRNALDDNPTFWTGQVNSPARPLLYNVPLVAGAPFGASRSNIGITVLDFIGGAISPDGRSVWASFVQDCGPDMLLSPECMSRWPATNPGDPQDGFAGRLVWHTR